jgi:hypothetical protein
VVNSIIEQYAETDAVWAMAAVPDGCGRVAACELQRMAPEAGGKRVGDLKQLNSWTVGATRATARSVVPAGMPGMQPQSSAAKQPTRTWNLPTLLSAAPAVGSSTRRCPHLPLISGQRSAGAHPSSAARAAALESGWHCH